MNRVRRYLLISTVAVTLLMILPSNLSDNGGGAAVGPLADATFASSSSVCNDTVCVNLALNSSGTSLPPLFWGTTVSPRARLLPNEGVLVNATPAQVVVWPGGRAGEDYDPINNTIFNDVGVGTAPTTSEAQFVSWCKSINCTAIIQVPAEIENASMAAAIVSYTEKNLSFEPAYWEIGNEPELWNHAGLMWWDWRSGQHDAIDSIPYALLVQQYITAMKAAYPPYSTGIQIIGLAAPGRPNHRGPISNWIAPVVAIDGPNISGVSYHSYPAAGVAVPSDNLSGFYEAINGSAGLVSRIQQVQNGIVNGTNASLVKTGSTDCSAACAQHIGIFVTEVAAGLSGSPRDPTAFYHWDESFAGALDLAAQFTQAMDVVHATSKLQNLDLFSTVSGSANSWFNLAGEARPDYTLYSEILNHLGTEVFPVNLTTPASCECDGSNTTLGSDLYGIATLDPGYYDRSDLMLVNLNLSTNVTLSPCLPGVANGTPAELWTWSGNISNPDYSSGAPTAVPQAMTSSPVPEYFPEGIPSNWTLLPQTVAVFESYPQGGVPVVFTESGFTPNSSLGPRWYVTVGGMFGPSNATRNITFFLPPGAFHVTALPIPLPLGGIERIARERYEPFLPSTIVVGTSPLNVTVPFVQQWNTSISLAAGDPPGAGVVSPAPGWWKASTPLNLTAHPGFGYVFKNWVEFENHTGNVTFTNVTGLLPNTSPWVNGSLSVKASFARAYPVTFTENGLAPGTDWSVIVRGRWSDTENETHHLQISNTTWDNTSVVTSSTVFGNGTFNSMISTLAVEEANGTYAFSVGNVAGYRSLPVSANFTVAGGRLSITVNFTPITPPPPEYPVTFIESGLPVGVVWSWSITVRNSTLNSTSSTLGPFNESNGSYGYVALTNDAYFQAHPRGSGFVVNGSSLLVDVTFAPVEYDVVWEETGLGPTPSWTVDVSGNALSSVGAWTTTRLANGTYSFVIPNVADYVPLPRSEVFSVNGADVMFNMSFAQAIFSVTFSASSVPPGDPWQVRLSNSTLTISGLAAAFREPNGSYTFDVMPPDGYRASPSHGTVTVDAAAIVIPLSIVPAGSLSMPPTWNIVVPALIVAGAVILAGVITFFLLGTRGPRRSLRGR